MKSRLGWIAAVFFAAQALTLATSVPAKADAFTTFDLSGTFLNGPPVINVPLTGTFTVDTTIGVITAANLFNGQFGPTTVGAQGAEPPQYGPIYVTDLVTPAGFVGLVLPVTTLVNYAGGNLVPGTVYFSDQYPGVGKSLQSGTATAEAVPEPGSMGLLMAAIGGVALFARRRPSKPI